jgi:hypothetical protein
MASGGATKGPKPQNDNVTFRLFNLTLTNVPFCHKTLSLRIRLGLGHSLTTDPTPATNFLVEWTSVITFQRSISRDTSGKAIPSIVDIIVLTHSVRGTGRDKIAYGALDLSQLVKTGKGPGSIPLFSGILESSLKFDVEMSGGESLAEPAPDVKAEEYPPLPVIRPVLKNGWFGFNHHPDLIEADANLLVQAVLSAASG